MRKRIALFIIGFVVAIGAFWLYQYFSGASFLSVRKPAAIGEGSGEPHPPTYEQRAPNGDLLYLLSAKKATPSKDENGKPIPGQYDLIEPMATYYTTDGNLLYIRADRGTVSVDDRSGGGISSKAGINDRFRGAHLAGHVMLTYGPRESFTDNSLAIKAGQFQVQFEKDLDLNYAEGIVTSPGLVHLRADQDRMRFDGENLTIAFNRSQKKQEIELLRIEPTSGKDNYMLIKDVGRQGFSLDDTATTRPRGEKAIGAATQGAAVVAAVPSSATAGAPTTQATGVAKVAAVIYKVSLGQDVTATLGGRKLTTPSLFVFFQSPNSQDGKKPATATSAPDSLTPGAPATGTAPAASAPAVAVPAKAAPDDLVVTWKGPLEMRPAAAADAQLSDKRDIALEAVGTAEQPVRVQDATSTAQAGILQYHRAVQSVALWPGVAGPVVITYVDATDPAGAVMTVTSQGVNFSRMEDHVRLEGPGHIEVPQAALRRGGGGAAAVGGQPLEIAWEKALDVDLLNRTGAKSTNTMAIRRALFAGRSSIANVDFSLDSDALDILVAAGGGGAEAKSAGVLERLLATGNVHVKGESRPGTGIEDAAQPDGVNADRLEVITGMAAGDKVRTPSRLLADGNVVAWAYQADQADQRASTGHLAKQTLYTPKLDVKLASKPRTGAATAAGIGGNVSATSLLASDGVIVELEGFGTQTVFAKAKTLTADMSNGRDSALVKLDGEQLADGSIQDAEVSQGERGDNKITGLQMLLDQKNKSIHIPGKGTFNFVQAGQKAGDVPIPAEVTWSQSMDYNGKTLLAHFLGDIDAHQVGSTDKISKLTCNQWLDVQLAADERAGAAATTKPGTGASKLHLAKIAARGNVNVQSTTLDAAGKVLTSIYLTKTDALDYTEASKTLSIPGPGQMLIQDYRSEKGDANSDNSHGDTVFTWDKNLAYEGPSGTITFTKNVWMKHRPLKPFKVPGAPAAAQGGAAPAAPAENQPLVLITDLLVAKLDQSKATGGGDTAASPFAMSAGGTQKLESVLATGHSVLTLGESKLNADDLQFNNLTHIATATGNPDVPAELFQPGQALLTADHISWDVTKGKNAIQATGIHGGMQQN